MSDDPRLQELLDELLESQGTPEEVCASCPELLPQLRRRWKQLHRVDSELDLLFPPSSADGRHSRPDRQLDAALPNIPGYEVDAVLGHGGMGVVYKARHLKLNRPVALKMMIYGTCATPMELSRFQREAEAVAGLRHPHIVQIYDVGDVGGRPYFTMEYIDGGSLAQRLKGTPQSARDAATLAATLADAVQAAHQN